MASNSPPPSADPAKQPAAQPGSEDVRRSTSAVAGGAASPTHATASASAAGRSGTGGGDASPSHTAKGADDGDATMRDRTKKVVDEFAYLLEKSQQLFAGLRDLPPSGNAKTWQPYFQRTFEVYTKVQPGPGIVLTLGLAMETSAAVQAHPGG